VLPLAPSSPSSPPPEPLHHGNFKVKNPALVKSLLPLDLPFPRALIPPDLIVDLLRFLSRRHSLPVHIFHLSLAVPNLERQELDVLELGFPPEIGFGMISQLDELDLIFFSNQGTNPTKGDSD